MNFIYRSIWNEKTGTFSAASENAKAAGKKSSSGTSATGATARFALKALSFSMMLAAGGQVYALPGGGVVAAGEATITGDANNMTISQATANTVINWQSFNIAQGQTVQFVQPGASSVALNRVLGSDPSSIFGTLSANGQVFLVNPNGVLFGQGASVNVGGLVASTLNISDSQFMAGDYTFAGNGTGTVLNQGTINANGGYVALLGAHVSNEGVIMANLGTVALAAGNAMTLDMAGDGLLNVTVSEGAVDALVENGGLIRADGGQVLMTGRGAGSLLKTVVNNTGVIEAQSFENRNGIIRLLGGDNGTVLVGGTLDASGLSAGQSGGTVHVLGHQVALNDARINTSGDAGGGTVLIGGDYQGKNAAVQNASATYMSANSSISADAITTGNGGKVILWGDNSTRAYGSISARGGAQSGDGGLIETSGGWLDVSGIKVNTSAAHGQFGMWLLDPADITISSAATSGATSTGNVFAPDSGVNAANINVGDLVTALGGSNITVTTQNTGASGTGSGDITVQDAVSWTAATTLTLDADRDVNVNLGADITGTDGSLVTTAKRDINVNAAITTTTGNLSFTAVNNVNMNAATTITTGNFTAVAGHDVTLNAAVSVTTGDVILHADNDGTGPGAIIGGTASITCGINCITIGTGNLSIRFNPVNYASTNAEILAYNDNLTGGGILDAKAWVFGQGSNKVYDGQRTATVNGLEPDITAAAPPVALGAVTNALFDTRHVGVQKVITYETVFADAVYALFAPVGTAAGTYVTRANITPAPLTINAVNDVRVYNGTTSSDGTPTAAGLQAGDTVINGPFTQAYANKNVLGTNASTLIVNGTYVVADGNGGNNYTVALNTAPGTITPLALVGSITAADKTYDSTSTATITGRTLAGVIGAEDVRYTGGSASFDTAHVGTNKTVRGTGLGITGADAGNYTVNTTATTTASITEAGTTSIETLPGRPIGTDPKVTDTMASSPSLQESDGIGGPPFIVVDNGINLPPEQLAWMSPVPPVKEIAPDEPQAVQPVPVRIPPPVFATPRPPKQDRH
jgi:filamentous hemagglutinin family protein